jgi:ABC-2 type transport system permease protein
MVAVFWKDLRLILRDPWALGFALAVPIFVITIVAGALWSGGDDTPRITIPIVDEDRGPVAGSFRKLLADHAVLEVMDRAAAERMVAVQNRAPAALVFPPGLSRRYLQGRPSTIELLTDPAEAEGVAAVKVLLLLMDKEAAALADPLSDSLFVVTERNLTGNRTAVTDFESNVPGFTIMFTLLAILFGVSMGLHDEGEWGTLSRLLVAPAGFTWMLLGKLGARFVLGFGQLVALLLWIHFIFGVSLGPSIPAFLVLCAMIVFCCVSLGLVVGALAKTREQSPPLGLGFMMVWSGMGGLFWPSDFTPDWMRAASEAFFTTWAMRGMNDLVLRNEGLAEIAGTIAVLFLFGLGTLIIGLRLFRTRHSAR